MRADTTDTICAISTAPGVGGIAVVRVSGPQAIEVTDKIYKNIKGITIAQQPSHTAKYGTIYTPQGEILDDVVVTLFKAPHSFTGDDTVEISCHGSQYIQQTLSNARRIYTPSLHQWQNGPGRSRRSSRCNSINHSGSTPSSHKSNARKIQ